MTQSPKQQVPNYNFKLPAFQKRRIYIRYAKEHLKMIELENRSDVISWEVLETVSPELKIPIKYEVHFQLNSIVGIDKEGDPEPIYGDHHVMELTIPKSYPLQPGQAFMLSDVWHPNIKSEGRFKGRICLNIQGLGLNYYLDQLVLRVGEMLQYKNYHAEFTNPYPEDQKVAKWVLEYAEPNDIINKRKDIYTDTCPLIRLDDPGPDSVDGLDEADAPVLPEDPLPAPPAANENDIPEQDKPRKKISIKSRKPKEKEEPPKRRKIKIRRNKDQNED